MSAVLYTAKCYWPGVTEDEIYASVVRAGGHTSEWSPAAFRGALYLPVDELVLCLFDLPSPAAVKQASERAGMPCERVIETVWVAPLEQRGEPI